MLTIESCKVKTSKPSMEVYNFLMDLNNLEKLMPVDKVEKWTSTNDSCRFSIKKLATIGMKFKSSEKDSKIVLESDGKNPFTFTLSIFIESNEQDSEAYFVFEGDVNMFMKVMVEKPLKYFFDTLAKNLPAAILP